jgi:radical SAM protein with 4Fe4S-binding SPASM domain
VAISEESYADFSRRVHGKAAGKRVPVNIDYDVTYRCNLNCRHCYCNLPANDREAKAKELTLEEIERMLTEARDLGALWILLTGGEPLLRPDFKDIYLTVLRLGLIPSVFTNGTLVTEEWADFFAEYRPFKMEITLYGSCADVYERVTRTPGSFERCMRGIRLLNDRGLPLLLKSMVLRSNWTDIPAIRETAGSLGGGFRMDGMVQGRYTDVPRDTNVRPKDERLLPDELLQVDRDDMDRLNAYMRSCEHLVSLAAPARDRFLPCGAGRSVLNFDPDGTVRPCGNLRFMGWSGRTTRLRDIWNTGIGEALKEPSPAPDECSSCRLHSLCGQCPAWSWLEFAEAGRKVPFMCAVARARYKEFGPSGQEGTTYAIEEEVPAT